jgi:hypothetical protein
MSFAPNTDPGVQTFAKPDALLRVPVGMTSPLWGLFAGAAISGAAWWWMTRWTRPENLEAMFGGAGLSPAVEPEAPAALETVAPEPVLEALVEAPPAPEPVGGESAPISPVLEVLAPEVANALESPTPAPTPKSKRSPDPKTI